jgi:hypothetical protein
MAITLILLASMAATPPLSASDQTAAFKAAGFSQKNGIWRTDCDDPGVPNYEPGKIEQVADLNGDGRPEAVITEGGLFCYGNTGTGFRLVSRQSNGKWVLLHQSQGIPTILTTRVNGWPEIEVGGPGFCFPVLRWNGKEFANHRQHYEGKPCRK